MNEMIQIFDWIRTALELGWPAIVLIMLWMMWSEYKRKTNEYIETLREIAGLRPSLHPPFAVKRRRLSRLRSIYPLAKIEKGAENVA